jgi:molybdate transport system substrate-binding protein
MGYRSVCGLLALGLAAVAAPVVAGTVRLAVAANFQPVVDELVGPFERASGHRLLVTGGSTGKLAAQIEQGAPFDVLLAADAARPERLEQQGLAVAGSRFTYARGRLVLWSATRGQRLGAHTLRSAAFAHLAIADPVAAPYGAAAIEVLSKLGLSQRLAPKLVRGESIGQTYAFVASGAAEVGFVALSQVVRDEKGSRWLVPEELHAPIEQQAVLLAHAADAGAARSFLAFLRGSDARRVVHGFGYEVPEAAPGH